MSAACDPIDWEATLPIRPSSPAWAAAMKALYGSPLSDAERALFLTLSGGREPSTDGATEFEAVVGRRGGKSEQIARLGVFEATQVPHGIALAPGQRGVVPVISPLREQSQEIMGYARGLCTLPQVKRYLDGEPGRDEIKFKTGVSLRVMTADALNVSGPTIVCAIRDEWAKFPGDDSAMPDREIENSLRPALAPVLGAPARRLVGITSSYIREGIAFETDRDYFGIDDAPVLVIRGDSQTFNPNLDPAWLERERKRVGERVFAREYLCEWQDAVLDGYFGDVLDGCVDRGRLTLPPIDDTRYVVALDPAWKHDRFALAVVHRERRSAGALVSVVDRVETWAPPRGGTLSTDATLARVAEIALAYGTRQVVTDQAAAPALAEAAQRRGLYVREVPWIGGVGTDSKASKFRRVHAAMADGLVRLPDDAPTLREFANVASRLLRSGGEQIEARVGHDDRVSAVVLAITEAMKVWSDYGVRPKVVGPAPGTADALNAEIASIRAQRAREIARTHRREFRRDPAAFLRRALQGQR
jgi:hypothetical protein